MSDYDRRLPPLASLVAFEAAYRHANFSRAAEELFQSQTTISRRIRTIEDDLGVRLFDRNRHDVTPTAAADELVASVRLSLGELAATADRLRAGGPGSLTVLTSLVLASAVVTPAVSELQRRHPELQIRVVSACEPIETTAEDFDVAVQYGPGESRRFAVEFVADEAVFPVCSPTFAAGLPDELSVAALAKLPLLDVEYDDPSWPTWSSVFAALDADAPTCAMSFTSYAVALDVAARGEGVALGWERSVAARLANAELVRVGGVTVPRAGSIHAHIAPRATADPLVAELLTLLPSAS
ncbi:MAG: LysR substrate-binding domain-containing protein [Actinomycetota bacterium]